jgi:hypothetical protein
MEGFQNHEPMLGSINFVMKSKASSFGLQNDYTLIFLKRFHLVVIHHRNQQEVFVDKERYISSSLF